MKKTANSFIKSLSVLALALQMFIIKTATVHADLIVDFEEKEDMATTATGIGHLIIIVLTVFVIACILVAILRKLRR